MEQVTLNENISYLPQWLSDHQQLLLQYAVNLVTALIILLVGIFISRLFSKGINRLLMARGIDATISNFLAMLLRYGVLAITLIAVLGRIGVQTTSVIAILGAAGLAVGLALQGSLSNFAAGVLIVIFRPFKVGEFIQAGAMTGTVDSVQLFSTTFRTVNNVMIIIPNSQVVSGEITNYTRMEERRLDLVISVSYNTDIEQVKRVLNEVIAQESRILIEKEVVARLLEMTDSGMNFAVRVWVSATEYWDVYYDFLENIKKALDKNQIEIPYPQMDIRMRTGNNACAINSSSSNE